MRIAIIGNMNNNHFALTRYLRDLGADAHLFIYSNEHDHFRPEVDTNDWDRWAPFVSELGISNGGLDALFGSLSGVREKLAAYDRFIANGIAPVLFNRIGRRLDLFDPYGHGIEFISEFRSSWRRPLSTAFQWFRKTSMIHAIQSSVDTLIIGADHPNYRDFLHKIEWLPIITKYDGEKLDVAEVGHQAQSAIRRMADAPLAIFSQAQHRWKTQLGGPYDGVGKRNNWLIDGFARYVQMSGRRDAILCLLEYGPDVEASKELIASLGIPDQVIWLPKMSRLELLAVARSADIGADAFAGILWGGTGWETISLGLPLLHYMDQAHMPSWSDMPLPPFLNATSPDEIAKILTCHTKESLAVLGRETRDWHELYQGKALAKRYLTVLGLERFCAHDFDPPSG